MAFRIFRVHDDSLPRDKMFIDSVIELTKKQFPGENEEIIHRIPKVMRDPVKKQLRSILFIAVKTNDEVLGFALLYHSVNPEFCYMDYLATNPTKGGRGIGNALYDQVREECKALKTKGLFYECLPDTPELSPHPVIRNQNMKRLAFYEPYGARPIIGTAYETPVTPGDSDPPYLVFDPLGEEVDLPKTYVKKVMRAVLERKYDHMCSPEYISKVVSSIKDEQVKLRDFKYFKPTKAQPIKSVHGQIPLICNTGHEIHHVRERGYVEAPIRIKAIESKLIVSGIFNKMEAKKYHEKHIRAVHDGDFVTYLKTVCAKIPEGKSVYPYVFPIRNQTRKPTDLDIQAGYYCIDTFTPLSRNAYKAAVGAVDCAMTAADELLSGKRFAYALVRPPGHHAESKVFGGFCYLNSNAVAANYLSQFGKVSILDIDYHHGNGQQDIFYKRSDVQTVSIHGDPKFAYPYFTGFENETGEGEGEGHNVNFALPEKIDAVKYLKTLDQALKKIIAHNPKYIVLALGLDTAKSDPTGTWPLVKENFEQIGQKIAALNIPVLIVQEGGYLTKSIGQNAVAFFKGLTS